MSAVHGEVSLRASKLLQVWAILLTFASPSMSAGMNLIAGSGAFGVKVAPATPVFDDSTPAALDAATGQTLLLPCTVRHLGDRVVSWIRRKDLQILSSGLYTFSSDSRFEVVHSANEDFWGLRIRGVDASDAGQYECQVNTDPKMSLDVTLAISDIAKWKDNQPNLTTRRAVIPGPSVVYVLDGSPATFTCEILDTFPDIPQSKGRGFFIGESRVEWMHDNNDVAFVAKQISIDTTYHDSNLISILRISKVNWRDSGQYTCKQDNAKSATVKLVVVENEHTEAMQRDFPLPASRGVQNKLEQILILIIIFCKAFICINEVLIKTTH